MPVTLSVPATLPKRGYSQIAEITSGKLVLIAGQVPHDVNDKLVAPAISPPRSSRCSATSMPPCARPAAPSTIS